MAKLDKVRWHCRRGLLELDVILERFNSQHLTSLADEELYCFEALLEFTDNDLLDLIMHRSELHEARYAQVLELLRAA